MANTTTVANLQADLTLNTDGFSSGVNNAAGATENLTSAILKADAVKFVLQGVADFAKGVTNLVKESVGQFQEYEQLTGGVETLFGAGGMKITEYAESVGKSVSEVLGDYADLKVAENMVIKNAHNAFKTAGMDANQYMETVTSFSASLLQSLGGDSRKAAQIADMAIIDISDNVNKMGSNMADVENAYKGFAKQNYTMLDNLKLGYGGTKTEMERLLKDAQELTGIKYDIDNLSDVYEAIHVIQTEMGITGTTAKEAATTIEGSHKQMEASYKNLLTSMVTGGEWFDSCIDGFVESVKTYVDNLLPAIEGAMHGFAALIGALAPMLASELPGFVEKVLPDFVNAVTDIINGILTALPGLLTALTGVIPLVTDALVDLIPSLISFILEGIPLLVDAGYKLLTSLVSGLSDNVDEMLPDLTTMLMDMVDKLIEIISGDQINLITAGAALITQLADGITKSITIITDRLPGLITDIVAWLTNTDNLGEMLTAAISIFGAIVSNVPAIIEALVTGLAAIVTGIADYFKKHGDEILQGLKDAFGKAGEKLSEVWNEQIKPAFDDLGQKIRDFFTQFEWGEDLLHIVDSITETFSGMCDKVKNFFEGEDGLGEKIKGFFTSFEWGQSLNNFVSGITGRFTGLWDSVKDAFEGENGLGRKIKDFFLKFEWGQALVDFIESIKTAFSGIWDKVKEFFTGGEGLATQIKNFFSNFDWGISLITFVNKIGNAFSGMWEKVKKYFEGEGSFKASITNFFTSFDWGETLSNFVGNIANAFGGLWNSVKEKIEAGWSSFRSWFDGKISSLLDGVKDINIFGWKPFGGSDDTESNTPVEPGAEPVEEEETLIDMPSNMLTLDYGNLEPIPMETLESYQLFAEAINAINTAISGGEGIDGGGLNAALAALPALMEAVLTAAENLAGYLSDGFIAAITILLQHLCQTSTDEEGNVNAGGGNTLYTAMGSIYGLFQDIYATSQLLAQYWSTTFIEASKTMRTEAGNAAGALTELAGNAAGAAGEFWNLANAIMAVVSALEELSGAGSGGGVGGTGSQNYLPAGACADGGPVIGGLTYLVGEKGPELFTPRQSGWITSNEDLQSMGGMTINVVNRFDGDVIGDEESISGYVTKATHKAIEEAVYAAV